MKKVISIIPYMLSGIVYASFILIMWFEVLPMDALLATVVGRSMEPTLHNKQIVFGELGDIERGDIATICLKEEVTEQYPDLEDGHIIKRVIGIPGDHIMIEGNVVFVNGIALEEIYLSDEARQHTGDYLYYADLELGEREYFVMGDNRGNSLDSRIFGPVIEEDFLYKQSITATWSTAHITGLMLLAAVIGIFPYFGCYIFSKKLLTRTL